MDELAEILERQDGVIARRQALAAGITQTKIARRLRRRDWIPLHPGVYVNHTGPPTWRQRAWAAVLACWPAALDGWSSLRAHEGRGRIGHSDDDPIEVAIPADRRVRPPTGVRIRRSRNFEDHAQANLSPPRMRYDETVVALADQAGDDLSAIAILADACGGRRTTATRLSAAATRMARLSRRSWLLAILTDIAEGTCSVLEHGYLERVERAHHLPRGLRQVEATAADGRRMFRDVRYGGSRPKWRLIVELDGRLGHTTSAERDRDLERDLEAATDREETIRLGYGQVFRRACQTAAKLERVMHRLGWTGSMERCPACPPSASPHTRDRGGSHQTG